MLFPSSDQSAKGRDSGSFAILIRCKEDRERYSSQHRIHGSEGKKDRLTPKAGSRSSERDRQGSSCSSFSQA